MRYEKGRKDASRSRILEVAAERFRRDGIAATGLASIMSDAELTNGAFYPHFQSKAQLVSESVLAAMKGQARLLQDQAAAGGMEMAIAAYLSPGHRDNPEAGCALAALLPELARQPEEARRVITGQFMTALNEISEALPQTGDREATAIGIYATLIGTLQLARAVEGKELSDRILAAGAKAAREMAAH